MSALVFDRYDADTVREAVDALPEHEKVVFSLTQYEGLARDAAAASLGVSPDAIDEIRDSALSRIASWLAKSVLSGWGGVDAEKRLGTLYAEYERELTAHYRAYFAVRPREASDHPLLARDLEAALPPGHAHLQDMLPRAERHRWHLSGRSSQVLALGLLGSAIAATPDGSMVDWFVGAAGLSDLGELRARPSFEFRMPPALLSEEGHPTTIDLLLDGSKAVVCVEAKWSERGMGACSCAKDGGDPSSGECRRRPEERPQYWAAARECFGLRGLEPPTPCPLSFVYQAARNVAAARALAADDSRLAVFCLIYDANNPYFRRVGDWPGWPDLLERTLKSCEVRFAALSWQALLPLLPSGEPVKRWAYEKHRLGESA